jgi:hypothetical protein
VLSDEPLDYGGNVGRYVRASRRGIVRISSTASSNSTDQQCSVVVLSATDPKGGVLTSVVFRKQHAKLIDRATAWFQRDSDVDEAAALPLKKLIRAEAATTLHASSEDGSREQGEADLVARVQEVFDEMDEESFVGIESGHHLVMMSKVNAPQTTSMMSHLRRRSTGASSRGGSSKKKESAWSSAKKRMSSRRGSAEASSGRRARTCFAGKGIALMDASVEEFATYDLLWASRARTRDGDGQKRTNCNVELVAGNIRLHTAQYKVGSKTITGAGIRGAGGRGERAPLI